MLALSKLPKINQKITAWLSWFSFIGLILCLVFYRGDMPFVPGFALLVPCALTAVLIYGMQQPNSITSLFSSKAIVFIGKISYSLYLFHWLFIAMVHYITGQYALSPKEVVLILVLTIVFSVASYYCLEQPLRRKKLTFKQALLYVYIVPSLFLIGFNLTMKQVVIKPREHSLIEQTTFNMDKTHFVGMPKQAKVAIIGDSHAGSLKKFADYLGNVEGWRAEIFENDSHLFVDCLQNDTPTGKAQCMQRLQNFPVVVIEAFYNQGRYEQPEPLKVLYKDPKFYQRFRDMVTLLAKHKKVIVMGDVWTLNRPAIRETILKKYGFSQYLLPVHDINFMEHTNAHIEKLVAGIPNVTFINPLNYLHKGEYIIDGKNIFKDQDHLNDFGSYLLAKRISEKGRFLNMNVVQALYPKD